MRLIIVVHLTCRRHHRFNPLSLFSTRNNIRFLGNLGSLISKPRIRSRISIAKAHTTNHSGTTRHHRTSHFMHNGSTTRTPHSPNRLTIASPTTAHVSTQSDHDPPAQRLNTTPRQRLKRHNRRNTCRSALLRALEIVLPAAAMHNQHGYRL